MIKLCIISTIPTTIKAFFGEQLKYLKDNGFDITVITSYCKSSQDFGNNLPEGVNIEYVRMSRTIRPFEDLMALGKILKIMRRSDFDIVQYVTPKGVLFGSIASWIARVPIRLYLMWGLYYITQTGFKRFVFKSIEKTVCTLSTCIAPDSRGNCALAVQEKLCKPAKIGVVGHGSANGVDTNRFDPGRLAPFRDEIRNKHGIPPEAFVLGTIAAIAGDKGINELVWAFVKVATQNPNVYLLYVGQTAEKDPVKPETLEQIENHEHVIHVGWQTEPEKYMAAMDAFVLPTYREGFGVVNIEASAMKLPVISTDVPGPQESIVNGETGILVPAQTVEPLVEAMRNLIQNPEYTKRLGMQGRERIQKYYEQQMLWKAILEHRRGLLLNTGKYKEIGGRLVRK